LPLLNSCDEWRHRLLFALNQIQPTDGRISQQFDRAQQDPRRKALHKSGAGLFWGLRGNHLGQFTAMQKINEICNLIASLEMKPADAEFLRKMMFDFRVKHGVAYNELMKIPGMARVWTTTETLAGLSRVDHGKRGGGA
jgi:hypothetical protein